MTHPPTPGPFPLTIRKSASDVPHVIITNQGNHYASTYDLSAARLIAAAPGMLAALQDARDYLEALLGGGGDAAVDLLANSGEDVAARLSAAIAKATGREDA